MSFQAVIMAAGSGSRMRELTSGMPKCLLPVGNVPLIMGPINILKRAGFYEAIVIVREVEKNKIQNAIENKVDMKLEFVSLPKHEDWGTADSLRFIKDKIKSHVIVLSCDLVSDLNLKEMITQHQCKSSDLTVLLVPFPKYLRELDMPGSKKKCKFERDVIGLDPNGKLIFINSEADFEETVPFRVSVLEKNSEIKVYSNLMDAHVYIINRDLINFLNRNEHISTLKGEFLPAAVKSQFSAKRKSPNIEACDTALASIVQDEWIDLKKLAFELSSSPFSATTAKGPDDVSCYSYTDKECFCLRINTLVAYADVNKKISKKSNLVSIQQHSHNFQKSQVDADSIVGESCELLTKASIKQSVLGNNCKLGEKCKVTGSVVMENVVFGKECTVQGTVICSNVVLEDNCSLKNCIIGPDQTIKTLSKLNTEILQGSEQLMEI